MSAIATIDGSFTRLVDDGYCAPTTEHSITDAQQQLSQSASRTSITVDHSKGISHLQRQILGTAYTMRAHRLRLGSNGVDYVTPLGIFAIFNIAPNLASRHSRFTRTARTASAQAALSRAATRLIERKLLRWKSYPAPLGYLLTDAGARIGACEPVPVVETERCVRYFGLTASSRWLRDGSGIWAQTPSGGGYELELIYEDRDAIAGSLEAAA